MNTFNKAIKHKPIIWIPLTGIDIPNNWKLLYPDGSKLTIPDGWKLVLIEPTTTASSEKATKI